MATNPIKMICPNVDECRLKINKEKFNERCIGGGYIECPIYICKYVKPEKYPMQWRGE